MFNQLLGATVQQADMRVGALNHLAIHLEHMEENFLHGGKIIWRGNVQHEWLFNWFFHRTHSFPMQSWVPACAGMAFMLNSLRSLSIFCHFLGWGRWCRRGLLIARENIIRALPRA